MKRVFKFGGASVKDAEAVRNMTGIIKKEHSPDEKLIVVVSAMGKTTNALEAILYDCIEGKNYTSKLQSLHSFHREIIGGLNFREPSEVLDELSRLIGELNEALQFISDHGEMQESEKYDRIVPFGELISTRIIHFYLENSGINNNWVDARTLVKTTDDFREGIILWEETRKNIVNAIDRNGLYLLQGFIGSTLDGRGSTLGREGSDFTAAIFGNALEAESVTIWKDVPGILNADPKRFEDTSMFENLSYSEASEMTYYGASVIHPKTIKPLANKEIPLLVKSFMEPEKKGTVISKIMSKKKLPVIILKQEQALLSFKVKDFTFINEEQIGLVFHALSKFLIKINVMQNSAISLTIAIDNRKDKISKLVTELDPYFEIQQTVGLSLFTIINHEEESIARVIGSHKILLEQRTLKTCQYIVSGLN